MKEEIQSQVKAIGEILLKWKKESETINKNNMQDICKILSSIIDWTSNTGKKMNDDLDKMQKFWSFQLSEQQKQYEQEMNKLKGRVDVLEKLLLQITGYDKSGSEDEQQGEEWINIYFNTWF